MADRHSASDTFESFASAFDLYQIDPNALSGVDIAALCGDPAPNEIDLPILTAALSNARSVLVEREYIDKDYRNVYSGYYSRKFARSSSRAVRLHLFDIPLTYADVFESVPPKGLDHRLQVLAGTRESHTPSESTPGYIGYIVLRPTEYSRIGRCLLDPRKLSWTPKTNARCALAKYRASVMGHSLQLLAFPHQSQDAEVHVCAHTAIWSLFRYLSEKYRIYREQYPFDIARLNTDLRYGRPFPSRGLYMDQVTAMFGRFGVGAESYDVKLLTDLVDKLTSDGGAGWATPQILDDHAAHGFTTTDWETSKEGAAHDELVNILECCINSGTPPVVGLPSHAAVAVGVSYSGSPVRKRGGRMLRSADFLNGFVLNDDNCAPYQTIEYGNGAKAGGYDHSLADIDAVVVPLPDKVFLAAEKAEVITTDLLNQLPPPGKSAQFVRRQYCTSSKNYKTDRQRNLDPFTNVILQQPLPHFLWVTEISTRREWSRGQISVEVALDATAGPHDAMPFLWVRYPRELRLNLSRIYGPYDEPPEYRKLMSNIGLRMLAARTNLISLRQGA